MQLAQPAPLGGVAGPGSLGQEASPKLRTLHVVPPTQEIRRLVLSHQGAPNPTRGTENEEAGPALLNGPPAWWSHERCLLLPVKLHQRALVGNAHFLRSLPEAGPGQKYK